MKKAKLFSICFLLTISSMFTVFGQTLNTNTVNTQNNTFTLQKNVLQNQTIDGECIIPASMGSQQITLENINTDKLSILGGSTIALKNCNIQEIDVQQNVTINTDMASKINTVLLSSNARINGDYKNVIVSSSATIDADVEMVEIKAPINLKLLPNADIKTLQVSEEGANIDFSQNAEVDTCVLYGKTKITGIGGTIRILTSYVNGVETDIKPDQLFLKQNANKITYTAKETKIKNTTKNTASKERLLLSKEGEGFSGGGKIYESASLNEKDTSLNDVIVNGDITIQQNVKNTKASLKNVTANGNVVIYGGKNIDIKNSNIQNIISHRSDRTPVTITFDSDTTLNNVIVRGNTILKGNTIKNVSVEQYTARNLEIDSNVKTLEFQTAVVETQINKKVETVHVNASKNTLKINMLEGSEIDELYTDTNVEITGTGTIHKIITKKEVYFPSTVTVGEITDGFISVESIDNVVDTMYKGKSITLSGAIKPYNASKQSIRWSIKDSGNTGAVLSNGNVLTAYKEGTIVVSAQIKNGINNNQNFTQDFIIKVENELANFIKVEDIAMTSPTVWDINEPLALSANVIPANATNTNITWTIKESGDTKAKIVNNRLTAPREGIVTVVATIEKGNIVNFTKEFKINILPMESKFIKVENIVLNTPNSCKAGDVLQLSGKVEPSNANLKEIQWQIVDSGKTGAYIQNHTNLYTRAPGNIVISARIYNGANTTDYYKEFNITVK